jgi:hypothetical protein
MMSEEMVYIGNGVPACVPTEVADELRSLRAQLATIRAETVEACAQIASGVGREIGHNSNTAFRISYLIRSLQHAEPPQ